jgi:hypothetical protein
VNIENYQPKHIKVEKCIFCGQRKAASKEHLPPTWFWKTYIEAGFPLTPNRPHFFTTQSGRKLEETHLSPSNVTMPILCHECNTLWGGNLQNKTSKVLKPFVQGDWMELDKKQMLQVARWFTSYLMVREMLAKNYITHNQESRQQFRSDGVIPRKLSIWLASIKNPDHGTTHTTLIDRTVDPANYPNKIHITTQELGRIMLLGIGAPPHGFLGPKTDTYHRLSNFLRLKGFYPIHPPSKENGVVFPSQRPKDAIYSNLEELKESLLNCITEESNSQSN